MTFHQLLHIGAVLLLAIAIVVLVRLHPAAGHHAEPSLAHRLAATAEARAASP
jgi:hypothetical protein